MNEKVKARHTGTHIPRQQLQATGVRQAHRASSLIKTEENKKELPGYPYLVPGYMLWIYAFD